MKRISRKRQPGKSSSSSRQLTRRSSNSSSDYEERSDHSRDELAPDTSSYCWETATTEAELTLQSVDYTRDDCISQQEYSHGSQHKKPPLGPAGSSRPGSAVSGRPGSALSGRPGSAVSGRPGSSMSGRPGSAVSGRPGSSRHSTRLESSRSDETVQDVSVVYSELQEINFKLKDETRILQEQQRVVKEREARLSRAEQDMQRIIDEKARLSRTEQEMERIIDEKVQEKIVLREQELILQIDRLQASLDEKTVENKRLMENFTTLKTSNDSLKKKVDSLQSQIDKLEKQNHSLQSRLQNLQRKQEFEEKKESTATEIRQKNEGAQSKQREAATTEKKTSKLKATLTQEVMMGLLEWLSELHLRFYTVQQPNNHAKDKVSSVQDKCVKIIPPLVEILRDSVPARKFVLPCLQFLYWSIVFLDQTSQRSALSATIRRLGEELFRARKSRHILTSKQSLSDGHVEGEAGGEGSSDGQFIYSQDLHVRFLSSLLVLRAISQADHVAQVFEVLRTDLKTEVGKELFLYYQATGVLLPHLKPSVKAASTSAIDMFLQLSMESPHLSPFLDTCSTEEWFRAVAGVWRASGADQKTLEKLSILLQKLSKIKSNKKYFEVFGFLTSAQEMIRSLGRDHDAAFLALNLKSILFNYNCSRLTSVQDTRGPSRTQRDTTEHSV